ncbi:MAG: P-loop NTPase fold protein, partial [Pseudomonadota bacterium]
LPDYLFWHDHRVASAASIYGQQGANFLIDRDVAVGLVDELETPEDRVPRANVHEHPPLSALLEERHRIDVVTRTMDKMQAWVDRDVALALQFARAFSGVSSRRSGELTWTHLFFGILLRGKGLQKDSRKNVAALCLYQLASPNDDNAELDSHWENIGKPISELKRSDAVPMDEMSPSAERAIGKAKELSGEDLITTEALLASLINTHRNDNIYEDVFSTNREGLIERIYEQAVRNSRTEELRQFLRWVNREDLTDSATTFSPEIPTAISDDVTDITDNDKSETGYPVWQIPNAQNDSADREEDLLDVEEEAKAFARLIASTNFEPPLAIGVFGPWGSGKTFFMNQIEKWIKQLVKQKVRGVDGQPKQAEPSFHNKIVRIPFNAWHYMESNVWASLVDVIFKDLDAWLRDENGGSKQGDEIDALFDSLTTAQEERLKAIEALAENVKALESARKNLSKVEEKTKIYWQGVLRELKDTTLSSKQLNGALNTLGLQRLSDEAGNLQNAITEARKTASDADLLFRSLRSRVSSPLNLACLAVVVLLGPFFVGWFFNFAETKRYFGFPSAFKLDETITTIAGMAASATAWLGAVTGRAKSGVSALRRLQEKFDVIDKTKKPSIAKLETRIDDAKSIIVQSEAAVTKAQNRLMENTSAGRVSAFIRERAESDVYSKHLGIIDTIRRDFEQLSALVEHSKTEKNEEKLLELHQDHVAAQIDAIKSRYVLKDDAYEPVREALAKIDETNKKGIKLGTTFDRIVLYIDDLDRCPPNKVYDVLQALHLFLTFPLFVVVVGVDTRWMETSLKEELGKLVDGTSGVNPKDYLEKIFQIPYWTRRMEGPIASEFVTDIIPEQTPKETQGVDGSIVDTDNERTVVEVEQVPSNEPSSERVTEPPASAQPELDDETLDADLAEDQADDPVEVEKNEDDSEVLTRPVNITDFEKTILAEFAPFAGRSPRKLLRFVNVYGLMKSVDKKDGSPFIDHDNDQFACRALIAQLALATGNPDAAVHHFDLIESSDDFSEYYNVESSDELEREPPLRLPSEFSELIWKPLRLAVANEGIPRSGYLDLYEKLKLTAPIARRYTFASSDAVQAMDSESGTQSKNSKE